MKTKARILTAISSTLAGAVVIASSMLIMPRAAAEYSVNFDDGVYSDWDGVSYTFDWYENPVDNNGVTTYTIRSASDLAGLMVLTNNLSNERFNYITDNINAAYESYIPMVDSFEGKVVTLDTDIDLKGYEWLGIGYPWSTPALTAQTEFINVEGSTVKYNAVEDIPDDTVDPWVGDKNGNPISTRYWEFPESELRFRDYTKAITQDATHRLVYKEDYRPGKGDVLELDGDTVDYFFMHTTTVPAMAAGELPGEKIVATAFPVGVDVPSMLAEGIDYRRDVAIPYTFKNINGYTETKGFAGEFDGKNFKIKGVNPDTTWTDDTTERLTTYEPIARGLFSMLDEKGVIKNLAVNGAYENEVCSYSAILCAYNYGTIDNCYVDGNMNQALIEQIYPIARDYDPDGSIYKLSETAGNVMPSGNAGFMTSQNYGNITNSYTVGEVEQAFRQFGFFASTNYGTISNCENRANFSTKEITKDDIDFHTDEWCLDGKDEVFGTGSVGSVYEPHYNPLNGYEQPDGEVPLRTHHIDSVSSEALLAVDEKGLQSCTTANFNGVVDFKVPWDCTSELWMPALYMTGEGESIAANHLYGHYEISVVGGIAAVNFGEINESVNAGDIDNSKNLITVNTKYNRYSRTEDAEDIYSYIRGYNQYGLFSTAYSGLKSRGGITGINLATISNCSNSGDIVNEGLTSIYNGYEQECEKEIKCKHLLFIAATQNGFYQNDVKFTLPSGETIYTPWGLRWWVTEQNVNTFLTIDSGAFKGEYASEHFDRNMPYPFFVSTNCTIYINSAGITGSNTGSMVNVKNEKEGLYYSLAYCSAKNLDSTEFPEIRDCNNQATIGVNYLINTNTNNLKLTHSLARHAYQTNDYRILNKDITVDNDRLVYLDIAGTEEGSFEFENLALTGDNSIALYGSHSSYEDVYMEWGVIERENRNNKFSNILINDCDNSDIKIFGWDGEISNIEVQNLNIVNSNFYSLGCIENSELRNVYINNIETNGTGGLGEFKGCTINGITAFADNAFFYDNDSKIENVLTYGTIREEFVDTHKEDFIYKFAGSECKDMWLESEIEFEFNDPLVSGKIQKIPGVLKAYLDTNKFEGCGIVTPDGMISYTTRNILSTNDDSIKTDAKLVYSKRAAQNGALAYYLDHGYNDDRTNEFTVAFNDVAVFSDYIPDDVYDYIDQSTIDTLSQIRTLPAHTRKKVSDNEESYYRVQVPYLSAGAGEVKISVNRNGETWGTNTDSELFPKTEVFVVPGEKLNFDIVAEEGYELRGLTWSTKTETKALESIAGKDKPYNFKEAIMPDEDVLIQSDFSDIWRIEVDGSLADWMTLTTSAIGAVSGRQINLAFDVNDPTYAVGEVFYCKYEKNSDNDYVLNTTDKYVIDPKTYSFEMPNTHIRIYATALNSEAELLDMVIAGVHGSIDEFNNVTVIINSSIDLTNLTVDSVELSPGATISPAIEVAQDFTNPVEYIVTSESGSETKYVVQVKALKDGLITQFDIKGRHGKINQDTGVITVVLPETEDVTSVSAYVLWSGTTITPDPTEARDYSNNDVKFTVTSSTGETKEYTVVIEKQSFNSTIEGLELVLNGEALEYTINASNKTIIVEYPYGEDVSAVVLKEFAFDGINSNLVQGQVLNLTISSKIIIVDSLGGTEEYTLMANEKQSAEKEITQFVIFGCEGEINQESGEIIVRVPAKYDITSIAPDAVEYIGESISDITSRQDYSNAVTITVTAFDGTSKQYTVYVESI